jgi:hypothetical protein
MQKMEQITGGTPNCIEKVKLITKENTEQERVQEGYINR